MKMHTSIIEAPISWHVIAGVGMRFEVVDHTKREVVAQEDWPEIYNCGELIAVCVTRPVEGTSVAYHVSAESWHSDESAYFEMQVTDVSKNTALKMFAAAYHAVMEAQ